MSKLNPIWDYSQPSFYHFTEDSTWLAKKAVICLKNCKNKSIQIADLCSGCGVVGIELAVAYRKQLKIDFFEKQSEFFYHFNENKQRVCDLSNNFQSYNLDYRKLLNDKKYFRQYDLIVSNPPYFNRDENRLGADQQKNICRFFIEGTFNEYIQTILWMLKVGGVSLFLCREANFKSIQHIADQICQNVEIKVLDQLSDTFIIAMLIIDED